MVSQQIDKRSYGAAVDRSFQRQHLRGVFRLIIPEAAVQPQPRTDPNNRHLVMAEYPPFFLAVLIFHLRSLFLHGRHVHVILIQIFPKTNVALVHNINMTQLLALFEDYTLIPEIFFLEQPAKLGQQRPRGIPQQIRFEQIRFPIHI